MGGFDPKTLKKEKGAVLGWPSRSWVVIQAMGRGVTKEAKIRYRSPGGSSSMSKSMGPIVSWIMKAATGIFGGVMMG